MKSQYQDSNYKFCCMCSKPLPIDYEKDFCSACEDDVLFREVREYIRSHTITEFELAEVFNIPLAKVRRWIKEGRIEYVEREKKIVSTNCQRCGAPISFGTLCTECMRAINSSKEVAFLAIAPDKERDRMRFLSEENGEG